MSELADKEAIECDICGWECAYDPAVPGEHDDAMRQGLQHYRTIHRRQADRIAEIEARLAATRPGPWLVNDEEQTVRVEHAEGGIWGGEILYDRSGEHRTFWVSEFRADAVFIAHAPADIAYLVSELKKARECRTPNAD